MFKLFASYAKAKSIADAATTDTLPMDLGFRLSDDAASVQMTLGLSGGEGPFAARIFTPAELDGLIAELQALRAQIKS